MPKLIELIAEYGQLMFDAGVHEREKDYQHYLAKAVKIGSTLKFLTEDTIEVPCPKCRVCSEAANRYCYDCGRKLKD